MFKTEGPIFTFLGKVFDIIIISIIWALSCIPVITVGAATTALYYTVVKVIRRDRGYLTKEYLKSFKANFLPATIIWIIVAAFGCLFYFEAQFTPRMQQQQGEVLLYIFIGLGLLLLFIAIYAFPILSRFSMNALQVFRSSVFMMLRHILSTVGMGVIIVWAVFIATILPASLMFIPGVAIWMMSYLMEPILKKYTPATDESEDEDSPKRDEWYLE